MFEMTSPRKGTETDTGLGFCLSAAKAFEMTSPRKGTETFGFARMEEFVPCLK